MAKKSFKDKIIEKATQSFIKSVSKELELDLAVEKFNKPEEDEKVEEVFTSFIKEKEYDPNEEIDLNKRFDYFLDEYYKFVYDKKAQYIGNCEKTLMEAFIGKIVAWYETTYTDDDLFYEFPSKYKNPREFITTLNAYEREYLHKHNYRDDLQDGECIYLNNDSIDYLMHARLFVSASGIITEIENIHKFSGKRVQESELIGLKLDDAVEVFKKAGVRIENTKLAKIVNDHNKRLELREKMLDAIMYKLIEHGVYNNAGCMRAYIFAKDFGRDICIPVKYSYIESSKAYREFINAYVHDGGSLDMEHYGNYFLDKYSSIIPDDEKFLKSSLRTDMAKTNNIDYNTEEETGLYQRLANNLVTGLVTSEAIDEIRTEAIKEMRLERKINKSKTR